MQIFQNIALSGHRVAKNFHLIKKIDENRVSINPIIAMEKMFDTLNNKRFINGNGGQREAINGLRSAISVSFLLDESEQLLYYLFT